MSDASPHTASEETLIDAEFTPATRKTTPSRQSSPSWLSFILIWLMTSSALGLGLLYSLHQTADRTELEAFSSQISGLASTEAEVSARLEALETRLSDSVKALREDLDRQQTLSADNTRLIQTLDTLVADLGRLGAEPVQTQNIPDPEHMMALRTRIDALEAEWSRNVSVLETRLGALEALQTGSENNSTGPEAHVEDVQLAFASLEQAAHRGDAFLPAYRQLADALADEEAIAVLLPYASAPPPSWEALQSTFDPILAEAGHLIHARSRTIPAWFQSLVGDGIRIRQTEDDPAMERLQAAALALQSDTPDKSIDILHSLEAEIQASFTDWLHSAEARQTLDRHLQQIRDTLRVKDRP